MVLTLSDWLAMGALILGIVNSFVLLRQYRKDNPKIIIEKKVYEKRDDRTRYLKLEIKNLGNREAKLTHVLPLYYIEKTNAHLHSPVELSEQGIKISARDSSLLTLKLHFEPEQWKEIESKSPIILDITFTFVHEKITKRFEIRRYSLTSDEDKNIEDFFSKPIRL